MLQKGSPGAGRESVFCSTTLQKEGHPSLASGSLPFDIWNSLNEQNCLNTSYFVASGLVFYWSLTEMTGTTFTEGDHCWRYTPFFVIPSEDYDPHIYMCVNACLKLVCVFSSTVCDFSSNHAVATVSLGLDVPDKQKAHTIETLLVPNTPWWQLSNPRRGS